MADQPQGGDAATAQGGLFGNARRVGRTLVAIVSTRLELLGVEAAEQGVRIGVLLVLGALALLFAGFALALLSFGIAVLFWDTHRLAAIFGLALIYALATMAAVISIRRRIEDHPAPFAATVAELKADAQALAGD